MKHSLFGLACVCSVSGIAAVACEPEVQRDLIECGDPAGQLDLTLVEKACTAKCEIADCREMDADQEECLEDCKRRAAFASGALWLIWQECRVANSCDGVFEVEKCQAFDDNYQRCICDNLAQSKLEEDLGCADLPLGRCSDVSIQQCVDLGLAPDACSGLSTDACLDPAPNESCGDCLEACLRNCENTPQLFHRDECLKLLADDECGEKWSAYGNCLFTADCDSTACEEEALAWGQCPDGPADPEKLEANCRAKCEEDDCLEPGSDETACLSECKSRGAEECGAHWVSWQTCRAEHHCDGVFEDDECAEFEDDYMDCVCELEPTATGCLESNRTTHGLHALRDQGRANTNEGGAIDD